MAFAPSAFWNSRSITHLANYLSPSLPMNSSDQSERICSRSRKIFGKFGKNAMCSFSSHWILRASLRCLLPREGLLHAAILGQRPYIEGLGDGYDYFQSMWRLLTWQWKNESTPMSHGCKDPSSTELSR